MLTTLSANNLAAIWAKRLSGTPTRIVIRQASTMSMNLAGGGDEFEKRILPVARRWYPDADGIVAVSEGAAADLASAAKIDDDRITTIYNPVRLAQIDRLSAIPLNDPWFEGNGPPVILSLGRLDTAKDYPTLLKAFAKVTAERPSRLLIIGEGKLRPQLLEICDALGLQSKVRFPGMDKNPFRYLKRADLFVLSSAWEGFPNALLEAMACGVSVVSTDCQSGPREILEDGRYGTLVPVGDADALARAMLHSLTRQHCSKADLRQRASAFSETKITSDYLNLLLPREKAAVLEDSNPDLKGSAH